MSASLPPDSCPANPFTLERLSPSAPFCDRRRELADFERYAKDNLKVALFSPRRYGKTSLLLRVAESLTAQGFVCAHADFSTVATVAGAAGEIMRGLFTALHRKESLLEKGRRYLAGLASFRPVVKITETGYKLTVAPDSNLGELDLFRKTVEELAAFVAAHSASDSQNGPRCCFIFDEFQDLTRLRESAELEAILRASFQGLPASCFFLGSRRGTLTAMFNDRKRPFFKMARNEELGPLPEDEVAAFVREQFTHAGLRLDSPQALELAKRCGGYAYYMQYLAQELFNLTAARPDRKAVLNDLDVAEEAVMARERHGFAGLIQNLPLQQLRLLKALAAAPEARLTGAGFIGRAGMAGSTILDAQRKLLEQDLIERCRDAWRVTDPFLAKWLAG